MQLNFLIRFILHFFWVKCDFTLICCSKSNKYYYYLILSIKNSGTFGTKSTFMSVKFKEFIEPIKNMIVKFQADYFVEHKFRISQTKAIELLLKKLL